MTKRNLYLEELSYKEMIKDKEKGKNNDITKEQKEELEKKTKEMEEDQLQYALKIS